ncbi:MAG TPA: glycosyltransferase family 4 protein [Blastococcus sp.]|jgi:glycosyltransferase involved in cell wall biosynthesis|nr:glycosyltransferase family 4 protein [Blastococcus sp.]
MTTVRALLVNENIGGHATVHHHLRAIAAGRADVDVRIVDVPPPGLWRKVAGVAVPGLARVDADLRAARYQLAQSAWVARQLPGWLAAGTDVVHFYTHNAALLAHRALAGIPYVVTLDSTNAQSNLLHPARRPTRFTPLNTRVTFRRERAVYAGARVVVANSRWCADSLMNDYGIPPSFIEVLPMGVPVGPPGERVPSALPRVLFVGRTMGRKGGYDLLDVHRRWLADRCELVLVTQDAVPPSRNVTVVGDVRPGDGKLDALLASSDLFVLPSSIDQWPNAVMEAMAAGVPPVVSAVGGMPEMVLDGAAGVVLPDTRPETMRDAISGLLDDPLRRRSLGEAARKRVEGDLDVRRTATGLLDLVREAASTGSP